jgi:hypothetical protein
MPPPTYCRAGVVVRRCSLVGEDGARLGASRPSRRRSS